MFRFVLLALLVAVAVGLQMKMSSKTDTFRQFRSYDPIRDTISFISSSFANAFSPLSEGGSDLKNYHPTMTKPMSAKGFRNAHKNHKWDNDDIAQNFANHFIYRAPQLDANLQSELGVANFAPTMNYDADPTNFVARGVSQAFSPMKSGPVTDKTAPPFHRQTKLSDLKTTLKKNPHFFSY